MQLINSFVSAVANGAMLMMSSSSNQSKSSPEQQQPNSSANSKIEQSESGQLSVVGTPPRKLLASKASADDEEAEVEEEGSRDVADEAESQQKQNPSLVNLKIKPVEVVVNPVITTEQKSQQTFDVNKKPNRKGYSEVILTESAASSINSDFRPRPNSMSLNNFNPIRTPTTTASANRPTNNFYAYRNNNNNNQNKNSYHKNNRHSVCLSAPTSARTSTTFNIDSKNSSFTKSTTPTARTFNSQKPTNNSNNNARNGSKFNSKPQTPNVNITKKK